MKRKAEIYGFAMSGMGSVLWKLKEIDCCYSLYGETSICSDNTKGSITSTDNLSEKNISTFLYSNQLMHEAGDIIDSWGNFASYKIQELIDSGELESRFTFINVPKNRKWKANSIIDNALREFREENLNLFES